jgi:hypothetical protein
MKEHIQIFDNRKFLRIMLIGLICYLICFVITLINIQIWGFFIWLIIPTLIIILFFIIGLFKANRLVFIEITQDYYLIDNFKFQLKDILSYDFVSTGKSYRFNFRLKNRTKISLTIRDSYQDKDKYMIMVDKVLADINNFNAQANSDAILEYDFYKTKNAKIVGVIFIIFDILITIMTIFNDSKRVPIQMKYFGALMINLVILSFVYRIFKKK